MSHLPPNPKDQNPTAQFEASAVPPPRKTKRPAPISLRLNEKERGALEYAAAGMPLSTYIKSKVFEGDLKPRRTRGQAPIKDHAALASALGLLGNMRLSSNLNQLTKAANTGTLPVTPETEEELVNACAAILAIKMELMRALGYGSKEDA